MTIIAQEGVFSWALQSTKYGNGTLAVQTATAKVVFAGQPSNANTLTVGSTTYTYKTTLSSGPAVANEIKIGSSLLITVTNTVAAIMAAAGAGTLYGTGTTANAEATAVSALDTVFLTSVATGAAGNAITLSRVGTNITVYAFANGLTAGAFDMSTLSWARHRAVDIDYDVAQDSRIFPLEVGGTIVPTGAYKAGTMAGGGASILPRLENSFGELLFAMMGQAAVATNTPVSSANTHTFSFDANALSETPWVAVRKYIPGRGNIRPQGVMGMDNKLATMRIAIPQNDVVSARVDFLGRVPSFDNYADAWLYANSYENADKAAYSCVGSFKIPAFSSASMPVTSVILELTNDLTTPREEKIVGSYFLDDIVVRTRSLQIRMVHKWDSPALYQDVYTNMANGTAWSPTPYTTVYSGGNYAFEANVQSTKFVTGTTPYSLTVRAGTVVWEPVGPVRLQGGSILSVEYRGTAIEPDSSLGVNYADFILVNGRSSVYATPAVP